MGDECTCDKCQTAAVNFGGGVAWPVCEPETPGDGRGSSARELYLVITERGISLRSQSPEL